MANLITDNSRLNALMGSDRQLPTADRLYRDRSVFFVGGTLPVYETLETMFNSFCTEATDLFYLTFGPGSSFSQSEEMARQIKKNFNVRLMANLDLAVDIAILERVYAAGVDNLILSLAAPAWSEQEKLPLSLQAARGVFPRWGVAATLFLGEEALPLTGKRIDLLLREGIVPLVQFPAQAGSLPREEIESLLTHLVAGWERSSVPLAAYLPLITVLTPLVTEKPAGLFRGIVDKLRDCRQLAGSDIRRHLRVQPAENSLDSAGL